MTGPQTLAPVRYVLDGPAACDLYRLDHNPEGVHLPARLYAPAADYLTAGAHELYDAEHAGDGWGIGAYRPDGFAVPCHDTAALVVGSLDTDGRVFVLAWDHVLRPAPEHPNAYALTGYALPTCHRGANTAGLVLLAAARLKSELS